MFIYTSTMRTHVQVCLGAHTIVCNWMGNPKVNLRCHLPFSCASVTLLFQRASLTKNWGFVSKHQIVPVFVSPLLSLQMFIAMLYYFPFGTVNLNSTSLPAEPTLQSMIFQINKKLSLFQCLATYQISDISTGFKAWMSFIKGHFSMKAQSLYFVCATVR